MSFLLIVKLSLLLSSAWAEPIVQSPLNPPSQFFKIDHAVYVQISAKGEKFFAEQFQNILRNENVVFNEGSLGDLTYQSEAPYDLKQAAATQNSAAEFLKLRDTLSEVLMGLELANPELDAVIKNVNFKTQLSTLKLVLDRPQTLELLKSGDRRVVLAILAEAPAVALNATQLAAVDKQNPILGNFGVDKPVVTVSGKDNSTRLRLILRFLVGVDKQGSFRAEQHSLTTNFDEARVALQFDRLLLPKVELSINNKKFPLNPKFIEAQIFERSAEIGQALRKILIKQVQAELPKFIVDLIQTTIPQSIEEVSEEAPAGAPLNVAVLPFITGMRMQSFGLESADAQLALGLSAFVEDTLRPGFPMAREFMAKAPPKFLRPDDLIASDFALFVNQGMINRHVQLSYMRGYISKFSTSKGETVTITKAPRIEFAGGGSSTKNAGFRVHLSIDQQISGLKKMLIRNAIRFDVVALGSIVKRDGKIRIRLDGFDNSTIKVDEGSLTTAGQKLKKSVRDGIADNLNELQAEWKKKENLIDGELPLEPKLFGFETRSGDIRVEPGYVVVPLNFIYK